MMWNVLWQKVNIVSEETTSFLFVTRILTAGRRSPFNAIVTSYYTVGYHIVEDYSLMLQTRIRILAWTPIILTTVFVDFLNASSQIKD
jgi:hypothetical protein